MRRLVVLFSAATLSVVGGAIGASAVASASTDSSVPGSADMGDMAGHPIVGTWTLTDTSDPESTPFTAVFTADGSYLEVNAGDVGFGAWAPTGPTSAAMSYTEVSSDGSSYTVRATIEVAADGQSFSATYTLQIEGGPEGEYGPGTVTATRAVVEPMGTPVGSIDDLFSSFGTEPPTSS